MQSEFEATLTRKGQALDAMRELCVRLEAIKPDVDDVIITLETNAVRLRTMSSNIQGTIRDNILFNTLDDKLIARYNNEIIPRMKSAMDKLEQLVRETKADASPKPESHASPVAQSSDSTTS